MRTLTVIALVLLFAPFTLSADMMQTVDLGARMTATEQNPPLAGIDGSARAQVTLNIRRNDEGEMVSAFVTFTVNINVQGQEDVTLLALHIHEAPLGVNGGIRIRSGLDFGSEPVVASGGSARIWRQVEIVDKDGLATVGRLVDNPAGFYVNIHSASNPGGLLRGQVFNADRLASMIIKVQSQSEALVDKQEFNAEILRRIAFRLGVLRRGE
jgi:hypothetical protein